MSRYLRASLQALDPYVPGEQPQDQQYIKLNTNESPYPPSPRVLEAVSTPEVEKLRLYSDPEARILVSAIAKRYGVGVDQVFVGNGSDEVLAFAFQAYGGGKVRFPALSYGFYPVFARLYGVSAEEIPLKEDFSIDPADYLDCGGTVVLANPNAPTGLALSRAELEEIIASNPDQVVLVDEAYVDFGGESCVPLLEKYGNLLVVQTFSKSRALAGARLGFALGSPELIADLNRIKFSFNPYNLNRLTILAGTAAMEDEDYFQSCVQRIQATRSRVTEALRKLGFTVLDSQTNFVFTKPPAMSGRAYYQALRQRGILVRHWDRPLIAGWVRVTIGSETEMGRFIAVTEELQS
ncbi:MAG: histidinol-phosphate transaminase [Oscillospiraceae bacterium]|nr:histidinol-phosphate transaminase [Oscillospiraceae bacterium]